MFQLLTLTIFHTFFSVSIVDFDLVNVSWEMGSNNQTISFVGSLLNQNKIRCGFSLFVAFIQVYKC